MMWLTHWGYIIALVLSIAGLSMLDWRFRLAWWADQRATGKSIAIMYGLLLAADATGVAWQIFSTNQAFVTGLYIFTPDLPIEEFFFLYLLCYCTLIAFRAEEKLLRGLT